MSTPHNADLIRATAAQTVSAEIRLKPRINVEYVINSSNSLTSSVVLDFHLPELDGFV
jgi:hypothetical protein